MEMQHHQPKDHRKNCNHEEKERNGTKFKKVYNLLTCSYKKKTAVENFFEAQPTIERLESGSKYIKTHSAIINVGRLVITSAQNSLTTSSTQI